MFSFFQTIFNKVTTVIATAAIAIGFISAPEPPKQSVLDNQNQVVVEQQIQKNQPEVSILAETEKLKKEIENLRKSINQQNQFPIAVNQPVQPQVQQPQPVQPQRTVPPRPENSDEWTFNWDAWIWEKHPSMPPIAPTINLPLSNQNTNQNQQIVQNIENLKQNQQKITDKLFPQKQLISPNVVLEASVVTWTGTPFHGFNPVENYTIGINANQNWALRNTNNFPLPYSYSVLTLKKSFDIRFDYQKPYLRMLINLNNPNNNDPGFTCSKSGNRWAEPYWNGAVSPITDHWEEKVITLDNLGNFSGTIEFTVTCYNEKGESSSDTIKVTVID